MSTKYENIFCSGNGIRTRDLWDMTPALYPTEPPRHGVSRLRPGHLRSSLTCTVRGKMWLDPESVPLVAGPGFEPGQAFDVLRL